MVVWPSSSLMHDRFLAAGALIFLESLGILKARCRCGSMDAA
jgi:hypothetical protein